MRRSLIAIGAAILAVAFASDAEAARRWFVQTSDDKIISFTDDDGAAAPPGTIEVDDPTIRAANPPGATGDILWGGTWIAGVYTAPSGGGLAVHIDPTTARGAAQTACAAMLDVFETALDYIYDNQLAWRQEAVRNAATGIHRQLVNATRVALNTTRTHARRQKFCEESASWPDGVNGDVGQYVDAFSNSTVNLPTKDWSWVNPETDPYTRNDVGDSAQGFNNATDVETAPGTDRLISRSWIRDIQ